MAFFLRTTLLLTAIVIQLQAQRTHPASHVSLSLKVHPQQLLIGECAILHYSFNVYPDDRTPRSFFELDKQYYEQMHHFYFENALSYDNRITQVIGKTIKDGEDSLVSFMIRESAICPIRQGTYEIPSLTLEMREHHEGQGGNRLNWRPVTYATKPVTITASGLKTEIQDSITILGVPLVGNFRVAEYPLRSYYSVNEIFEYQFSVKGRGLAHFIKPEIAKSDIADVKLIEENNRVFIRNGGLINEKTFKYRVTPRHTGRIDMAMLIKPVYYYNSLSRRIDSVFVKGRLHVREKGALAVSEEQIGALENEHLDSSESIIMLVDISQSMYVEDYLPTRLGYLKRELKDIVSEFPVEVVLFSGDVKPLLSPSGTQLPVDSIESTLIQAPGTAMGDAIWYALHYATVGAQRHSRKIIIIGDGDNTTGYLSPSLAAEIAAEHGFRIYSVGIGTSGLVDLQGAKFDKTFMDENFKTISVLTGGKYFWLSPSGRLKDIISTIARE